MGPGAVQALKAATALTSSLAATRDALQIVQSGDGQYTSGLLRARLDIMGQQPVIIPVWTGPDSHQLVGRLTAPVIADLINEACYEILLVSFATFPDAEVRASLDAAVSRGVAITTLLEREVDNPNYDGCLDPFPGLSATQLYWPAQERPPGAAMHAKVLVVDRRVALVGSANLTGSGLEKNLECGLLVRGGPVPAKISGHVLGLNLPKEGALHKRP